MKTLLFISIALLIVALHWTAALIDNGSKKCGRLNIEQVYNETEIAQPDEFPWLGRVFFKTNQDYDYAFRCLSVLITTRHLLSVAHCYRPNSGVTFVSLGDTGIGQRNYTIEDIAIHPNYNLRYRVNDLAVIQLKDEVELSPYIEPICLPPSTSYLDNILGQFLTYGVYASNNRFSRQDIKKKKIVSHIMKPERCSDLLHIEVPDTNICATSNSGITILSGSALMGLNVQDTDLKSYYLIAVTSGGLVLGDTTIELLVKVSAHINWINSNTRTKKGEAR